MSASEKLVRILVDCTQPGQNEDLISKFQVRGFPTLLFLDSEGTPLQEERHLGQCTQCGQGYTLSGPGGDLPPCRKCNGALKARTVKEPIGLMGRDAESVKKKFEEIAAKFSGAARWQESLAAAVEASKAGSKPLALLFTDAKPASQAYVKALEDKVLEPLFEKLVFSRLDVKKEAAEAKKYNVTAPPILYVVNPALEKPEAKPLAKIYGPKTAAELRKALEDALKKLERK